LSFSRHLMNVISKARGRIGLLYAKLPLQDLPLQLVKQVFDVFITPIFHYGLAMWISKCSHGAHQSLNAVWNKYLKRYLGIPPYVNNAIVYHITSTQPLTNTLKSIAPHKLGGLTFPQSFSGMSLSFIVNQDRQSQIFDPLSLIPSAFWLSKIVTVIPNTKYCRQRLMREIFDVGHFEICSNKKFHHKVEVTPYISTDFFIDTGNSWIMLKCHMSNI